MEQLFTGFAFTLFHSIWQAALVWLAYTCLTSIFKNLAPHARRNLLFIFLSLQVFTSIATFTVIYFNLYNNVVAVFNSITSSVLIHPTRQEIIMPIVFTYFAIILFKSTRLLFSWISFRKKIMKNLVKPGVEIKLFTQMKALHMGIKKTVQVWYSTEISTPLTFGFFKPLILLPISLASNLSIEEAESVIIHELTHIREKDYLFNWLLLTVEIIYFFNPAILYLCRCIKLEREKNCDVQVMYYNNDPVHYAQTLLKIARNHKQHKPFQLAAINRKPELMERIQFFSKEQNFSFQKNNIPFISLLTFIIILGLNAFVLPEWQKNPSENLQPQTVTLRGYEMPLPFTTIIYNGEELYPSLQNQDKKSAIITGKENNTEATQVPLPAFADEAFYDETENLQSYHASKLETLPLEKEMIIKEENTLGVSSTIAYTIEDINGTLSVKPLWSISALRGITDSLKMKPDSTTRIFNIIQ